MTKPRVWVGCVAIAIALIATGGCSKSKDDTSSDTTAKPHTTISDKPKHVATAGGSTAPGTQAVSFSAASTTPSSLAFTIPLGVTVQFTWDDNQTHQLQVTRNGSVVASSPSQSTGTWTYKPNFPGGYVATDMAKPTLKWTITVSNSTTSTTAPR
ncbi:MAG: hypothetical protein JWO88_458 [Frankiales bacterium]|nr:hypothetical protein [Frankiales bacterium]